MILYQIRRNGRRYRLTVTISGRTRVIPTTGTAQDCHASLPFFARSIEEPGCYVM